jgi:CheY-like chemotaxis protein
MKNILIVDDSLTFRLYLKKCLQLLICDETIQATEVKDGKIAWDMVQAASFDLIVSDVNMPVMSGQQFLQKVKGDALHADTPVIFVTSLANDARVAELMELGASAVLKKPLDPKEMADALSRLGIIEAKETSDGYG